MGLEKFFVSRSMLPAECFTVLGVLEKDLFVVLCVPASTKPMSWKISELGRLNSHFKLSEPLEFFWLQFNFLSCPHFART